MVKFSQSLRDRIIQALKSRGATNPCPRCGNSSFSLVDGYFNNLVQDELDGLVIGGPTVPSVVIACDRCGFLSQHAAGVLGLLSEPAE